MAITKATYMQMVEDLRKECEDYEKENKHLQLLCSELQSNERNRDKRIETAQETTKILFKTLSECMFFTHSQRRGAEMLAGRIVEKLLLDIDAEGGLPF